MHFEDLWEKCESTHGQSTNDSSSIIDELILKLNLYKAISLKTDVPEDEFNKIKSLTLGEILFTLTHLSLKENINVYESLGLVLQNRQIAYFDKKYNT